MSEKSTVLKSVLLYILCEALHIQNVTFSRLYEAGPSGICTNAPASQFAPGCTWENYQIVQFGIITKMLAL